MGFAIIPLVLAIFVGVVVVARRYMQKIAAAWGEAGQVLGLEYKQQRIGRPRLSGKIMGLTVEVDIRVQGTGKSQHTYTRYRVWYPQAGFEFSLSRQTRVSRITMFFGSQDVELGDATFDDTFVVKTDSPDRLSRLLQPALRGVLMRTAAAYPGARFDHDHVFFEKQGLQASGGVIVSVLRRLVDAALALSGKHAGAAGAAITDARQRGQLTETAARIRDAAREKADTLDEELLELDTLATAGDQGAARDRLNNLEKRVPADPDVIGWRRRLDEPKVSARSRSEESLGAADVAEDVFAGNALSFESKELFDEKYRGAVVRWTGRVKSADQTPPSSDPAAQIGVRVLLSVAAIDHDLYGNTDIDAVFVIPTDTAAGLDRGDEVTFTGTLDRVDALVRNILLTSVKIA